MQRINLFEPSFLPRPPSLGWRNFLLTIPFACFVLLLVGLYWRGELKQERERSEQARQGLLETLDAIGKLQQRDIPSNIPTRSPVELQHELAQWQTQLIQLQSANGGTQGYSAYLIRFAELHHTSLWLNEIRMQDKRLQLQGDTITATQVPEWIGRLQRDKILGKWQFSTLNMTRDPESPLLHFSLEGTTP